MKTALRRNAQTRALFLVLAVLLSLALVPFTASADTPPTGWANQDIGSVGLAGSTSYSGGTYTLNGAGADIWDAADGLQFAYTPIVGDATIVARVASQQNTNIYAKAGVMIRESLTAGSKHAYTAVTPGFGSTFVYRTSTGGSSAQSISTGAAPMYVKLVRAGNSFSSYLSSNGTSWTQVGSAQTISMNATVYVGLAVTSHNTSALSASSFDNVAVTGSGGTTPPPPSGGLPSGWADQDIGTTTPAGSASYSGGVYAVNGSGDDIWNTADGLHYAYTSVTGDATIVARVAAQQNTSIYAKAGVMIRESLTAGSKHAYTAVTPGFGSTFLYRTATGGSSAQSISTGTAPTYVKLVRAGNNFTSYLSANGTSWTQIGSAQTISMNATVYIGLAVTSHSSGTLNASTFDNVSVSASGTTTPTPPPGGWPANQVSVASPGYGSTVSGNTTIQIVAPGLTSATAKSWSSSGGAYGSDSTVAAISLDASGNGSFVFPANSYPHGPIMVRITGTNGSLSDTCYLMLYNAGGISWHEGEPAAPPQASGMSLVYQDDFTAMPSISSNGTGATYAAHKPGGGDLSAIPFADPTGTGNPFSQVDTYLRIRGDANKNTAGLISSLRLDGTGITATAPAYFEARFIAASAPGTWPAFWLMTKNTYQGLSKPADELDVIEAYGGEGSGNPNQAFGYWTTSHTWNYTSATVGGIYQQQPMNTIGGGAGWAFTPHVYGCKITLTDTIYYLDNVEVARHPTTDLSKTEPIFFMANLAIGGNGWPKDLSRYNNVADMYIDYIRVYK